MKFSTLRLLIVISIVSWWAFVARMTYLADPPHSRNPLVDVLAMIALSAAFAAMPIGATYWIWKLAGEIEDALRGKVKQQIKPTPVTDDTHE